MNVELSGPVEKSMQTTTPEGSKDAAEKPLVGMPSFATPTDKPSSTALASVHPTPPRPAEDVPPPPVDVRAQAAPLAPEAPWQVSASLRPVVHQVSPSPEQGATSGAATSLVKGALVCPPSPPPPPPPGPPPGPPPSPAQPDVTPVSSLTDIEMRAEEPEETSEVVPTSPPGTVPVEAPAADPKYAGRATGGMPLPHNCHLPAELPFQQQLQQQQPITVPLAPAEVQLSEQLQAFAQPPPLEPPSPATSIQAESESSCAVLSGKRHCQRDQDFYVDFGSPLPIGWAKDSSFFMELIGDSALDWELSRAVGLTHCTGWARYASKDAAESVATSLGNTRVEGWPIALQLKVTPFWVQRRLPADKRSCVDRSSEKQ